MPHAPAWDFVLFIHGGFIRQSPNISIRRSVRGESPQEIHKLSINLSHWSLVMDQEAALFFYVEIVSNHRHFKPINLSYRYRIMI